MTKEFIPYEQALELKELGFDEPCLGWYASDGSLIKDYVTNKFNEFTVAPLYQQAFRWFRDKYNKNSHIIKRLGLYVCYINGIYMGDYNTYEEAELECINKIIKIIKNDKKKKFH